jgi:hypothetical protein
MLIISVDATSTGMHEKDHEDEECKWKFPSTQLQYRMKSSTFWDITPCSPLKVNSLFGGTCQLHLQDRRLSEARNPRENRWLRSAALLATCFHFGFLFGLFFDPEDGGDMFLRYVG